MQKNLSYLLGFTLCLSSLTACDEAPKKTEQAEPSQKPLAAASAESSKAEKTPQATPEPTPAPTEAPVGPPSKEEIAKAFKTDLFGHEKITAAIKASERNLPITADQYKNVLVRRERALQHIESYLNGMFGKANPYVLKAFAEVPREYYHYYYQGNYSLLGSAYEIPAKPYPIGYGSALSDYLGQAMMTQIADPKPGEVSLEIGTGSGYQSSILSRIVDHAYSIEIIDPLGKAVSKIFKPLGFENITSKVGDGFFGWPEVKGGFDIIMLTCVARYVPPPLLEQLKPGGRLLIPLGTPWKRDQSLYLYTKDADGKVKSKRITGVYFIPMTGQMEKPKAP